MPDSENKAGIEPMQLGLDNRFKFRCHKGVDCFTKCCRGINIVLTPYDIIRLKNRLQLSSEIYSALHRCSTAGENRSAGGDPQTPG